jgi:hypothetical protein
MTNWGQYIFFPDDPGCMRGPMIEKYILSPIIAEGR